MYEYCVTKKKSYRLCSQSTESCATLAQTPVFFLILSGEVNELYQKQPRIFQILQLTMTVLISVLNEGPRERFAAQMGTM